MKELLETFSDVVLKQKEFWKKFMYDQAHGKHYAVKRLAVESDVMWDLFYVMLRKLRSQIMNHKKWKMCCKSY